MNSDVHYLEEFARTWAVNQKGGFAARLARWRVFHALALQKMGFHRWVKARLFFGEKMWVLTGENISRSLLGFGYAECALTAFMLEVIKPGMCVVDVGAHLEYEAVLASVLVGKSVKVVTFEPQPQISSWTIRNLAKFPQTRVVQSAVGDFEGVIEFSEMSLIQSAFSGCNPSQARSRRVKVPINFH